MSIVIISLVVAAGGIGVVLAVVVAVVILGAIVESIGGK